MEPLQLTIGARPTTKKTSSEVVYKRTPTKTLPSGFCNSCRRGSLPIVLPAQNYRDFEESVAPAVRKWWAAREPRRAPCRKCKGAGRHPSRPCIGCGGIGERAVPIALPVLVEAVFYRERNVGDLAGFIQALGDVLECSGLLENDRLILGWPMPRDGGMPLRKDADRPRIEIIITSVEAPHEAQAELFGEDADDGR